MLECADISLKPLILDDTDFPLRVSTSISIWLQLRVIGVMWVLSFIGNNIFVNLLLDTTIQDSSMNEKN